MSSPAHALPAPPTPLVGREAELAAVRDLVADGVRLVTLTGPGGVGKTRLGLAAAAAFPCATALLDLSPLRDVDAVPPATARGLGLALTDFRSRDRAGGCPDAALLARGAARTAGPS